MIPGKRDAIIFACLVLALLTALFSARRTKTALQEEAASLRTEVQRLTDEASSLRLERSGHLAQTTITQENHDREVARLRAENAKLRESIVRSQTNTEPAADKSPSPAIKARYIPPDAIKRGEYSFNGYTSPYSTLRSIFRAITSSDIKSVQAAVTGEMADSIGVAVEHARAKGLPEGVMESSFWNGNIVNSVGYRVLEEKQISDEEVELTVLVLLEESTYTFRPVFQRVGNEWKYTRRAKPEGGQSGN